MRTKTTDEMGMAWWNALTEQERVEWMRRAGDSGRAKDAWEAFKTARADDIISSTISST
jgi:hypothetical protein